LQEKKIDGPVTFLGLEHRISGISSRASGILRISGRASEIPGISRISEKGQGIQVAFHFSDFKSSFKDFRPNYGDFSSYLK